MLFRLIFWVATSELGREILIDLYNKYVSTTPSPQKKRKEYR